jgi:uncharacterized membrane protein
MPKKDRSEETGQELSREKIKALAVLLIVLLVVTLGVVLCKAAVELSPNTVQVLTYF